MDLPYDFVVHCALEPHGNILNNRGVIIVRIIMISKFVLSRAPMSNG